MIADRATQRAEFSCMCEFGKSNRMTIHPVAKAIIPPSTNTRLFLVSLSKMNPPKTTENIDPSGNAEDAIPAFPEERRKISLRYIGKKFWKVMRMVRHIMLVQINQNLELFMKLINASPKVASSRWCAFRGLLLSSSPSTDGIACNPTSVGDCLR